MSKRRTFLGLAIAVSALAVTLVIASRSAEPTYNGRPLTSWLAQCTATPLNETQRLAQAQEAVRAIGAPKALPTLLRLVQTKHNSVRAWVIEKLEKHPTRFVHRRSMFEEQLLDRGQKLRAEKGITLHWQSAVECQLEGIDGFEVLGTNCAPAVRELTRLLADKELAFVAVRCLGSIGKPAEAALCQCLTFDTRGCSLAITNGTQTAIIENGCSANFAPQIHRPFRATSKPVPNQQGAAKGRQLVSSEANRTAPAAASHRSP